MVNLIRALVLCLLMTISPAQAQQLRTLQLNSFREDPATVIGRLKGFFAAEGLEVKVKIADSSTEQMQGLIKGTFQLATGSFDNVLSWSGRESVELIAVFRAGENAVSPIYVHPSIKTWSDLRGKKLALVNPHAAIQKEVEFGVTVGLNRGGNYADFTDIASAERWLLTDR